MSNHYQRTLSLSGKSFDHLDDAALRALVAETLEKKLHGLCFSPYVEGQKPGSTISPEQIRERLAIVQSHTRWIRTFSCTEGHEAIPAIAAEQGLKTMVGVWLEDDPENNEKELANGIAVAQAGHADILAVGNEVLLRGELSEDELIDFINRARAAAPGVPVGYVDAYFKFEDHPRVTAACDVVLANCYPFWEGYPAEHALVYMKEMYRRAQRAGQGKRVIISETGWPDVGTPTKGSVPSFGNAIRYLLNACQWAEEEDIELFYFSAFDEAWKVHDEGDVGAYWGLWDHTGKPKYT